MGYHNIVYPRQGRLLLGATCPGVRGVPLTPGYFMCHRWWQTKHERKTMANWYYYDENGEKIGPIKGRDLNRLAKEETITPETRVEDENGRTALAKNVKGLPFYEARESESNPFSGDMSSVIAPLPPDQPIPPPFVPPSPPPLPPPPSSSPFAIPEGHVPPNYGGQQPDCQSPGYYPMREKTPGIFDFGFTRFITNIWISFIWGTIVVSVLLCWGIAVLNGFTMYQHKDELAHTIGTIIILGLA